MNLRSMIKMEMWNVETQVKGLLKWGVWIGLGTSKHKSEPSGFTNESQLPLPCWTSQISTIDSTYLPPYVKGEQPGVHGAVDSEQSGLVTVLIWGWGTVTGLGAKMVVLVSGESRNFAETKARPSHKSSPSGYVSIFLLAFTINYFKSMLTQTNSGSCDKKRNWKNEKIILYLFSKFYCFNLKFFDIYSLCHAQHIFWQSDTRLDPPNLSLCQRVGSCFRKETLNLRFGNM